MTKKELVDWLDNEVVNPTDITFSTMTAREMMRSIVQMLKYMLKKDPLSADDLAFITDEELKEWAKSWDLSKLQIGDE